MTHNILTEAFSEKSFDLLTPKTLKRSSVTIYDCSDFLLHFVNLSMTSAFSRHYFLLYMLLCMLFSSNIRFLENYYYVTLQCIIIWCTTLTIKVVYLIAHVPASFLMQLHIIHYTACSQIYKVTILGHVQKLKSMMHLTHARKNINLLTY